MAKLKETPITEADIVEYLDSVSDFDFELRTLNQLTGVKYKCEHGGTYTDPVTKKNRQYDIRARRASLADVICSVQLSVECKNLRDYNPLVVMTAPRTTEESRHDLIMSFPPILPEYGTYKPAELTTFIRVKAEGTSPYHAGEPVGKSCEQIGRRPDKEDSFVTGDSEVYDKWSQAIASAHDLADEATEFGPMFDETSFALILPVLVVPNGMLWQVDYSSEGDRLGPPRKVDRVSFYVNHEVLAGPYKRIGLDLTHLEFVTSDGLTALVEKLPEAGSNWFPQYLLNRSPKEAAGLHEDEEDDDNDDF